MTLVFRLATAFLAAAGVARAAMLEFNRDVRPILSENCFPCHGQDPARREAKLRLDDRQGATERRDDIAAIVPGKPEESEMLRRIASEQPSEVMPPPETHKRVTPAQAAVLRQWIAEGARYESHWAFSAPARWPLPAVRRETWPKSALDRWVLARLEREGLAPSPEAAPETWLRRVSFDLVGLPPTPAELDAFAAAVKRRGEAAYADEVGRLLASPHFGERQAIEWLDAARYADTHGFNNDAARSMWRWRDWVIAAFNTNLPYHQFITEQIAGDLLPQPTLEQRIATGFGRNHVINSEGGIIEEEYRLEYVADRVRTLSTAWLGLTLECARCHDHKFDPVTQRDYYRLSAFFNSVVEHGEDGRVANAVPMRPAPTSAQQATLAEQERQLAALEVELAHARQAWSGRPTAREALTAAGSEARSDAAANSGVSLLATESGPSPSAGDTEVIRLDETVTAPRIPAATMDRGEKQSLTLALWLRPDADNPRDVALLSSINYVGSPADSSYGRGRELRLIDGELELRLSERFPAYAIVVRTEGAAVVPGAWRHVVVSYAGGKRAAAVRIFVDGVELATRARYDGMPGEHVKRDFLLGADNAPNSARWRGEMRRPRIMERPLDEDAAWRDFVAEAGAFAAAGGVAGAEETAVRIWAREIGLARELGPAELVARQRALRAEHLALRRSLPTVMVLEELPQPRATHVLRRGQYDAPGEAVEPGVPESLLAPWPAGAPRNRLGLARWLTQPNHPLTARVVMNRMWAQLFGTGLVKTLEDFGSQSEWPSHPELLDELARAFVDGGWNLQAMLRTVVLSATYRQSSAVSAEGLARDPENRLLARGPRLRLPAELVRDQALAVAGLLAPQVGGPSVFPPQPEKLYEGIVVGADYPGTKWTPSSGVDRYRRSLYTFWKRTVPHPAMTAFDAPDREFCTVRRPRTNTPLQALALWNEPGMLEAARALGVRLRQEGGPEDGVRLAWAFRLATGRRPEADEVRVLTSALARLRTDFSHHPDDAANLLAIPGAPAQETAREAAELAATMSVASMILSLDETITKN